MNVTLLVVQGRPAGKKLVFPRGEYYFGRGAECHVRPESEWVSRQHCVLRVTGDGAYVQDLGSRNGTLVNGELVSRERRLWPGDLIQIGPLVFEVRMEVGAVPAPAPPAAGGQTTAALEGNGTVETKPMDPAAGRPRLDPTIDSTAHHPILPPEKVNGKD